MITRHQWFSISYAVINIESILTCITCAERGSITLIILSLHVVTIRDPLKFQEAHIGMSGKSNSANTSQVPTFHMNILLSDPRSTKIKWKSVCLLEENVTFVFFFVLNLHKILHLPALRSTFWADGCQTTRPTRLWWATKSATGSSRFLFKPPSGIFHIWFKNIF